MKTTSKAIKEEGTWRKLVGVCVCDPIVHRRVKSKRTYSKMELVQCHGHRLIVNKLYY